ncbi:2'-5' RNA ligase family protein [Dyella humicola]|uniref:2'-5' RNA ligase family protein n=1 Tax=Dyella humicola TaxID=2992126 RepID=UPI0022593675|nr:2'-5' RNA ligase family protein [Dyella humicola]
MLFSDATNGPSETLVADLRDYPEWHRGRLRFGLWLAPVMDEALHGYAEAVRQRLSDLLHPMPQRQLHLTLFVCGFEQPTSVADDDFTPAQLSRQIERLNRVRGEPCVLPLGPVDSFASAAFIPVGDPEGRLSRWRDALGCAGREIRQAAYVPHITLGLYRRKLTAKHVRARLGELDSPPTSLRVTELHYATYSAQAHFGPLESHHRIALPSVTGCGGG